MIVQIKNNGKTFELSLLVSDRMEELFKARESGMFDDIPPCFRLAEDIDAKVEDVWETGYLIDGAGHFGKKNLIMAPRPTHLASKYGILYIDRIEFYEHDQLKITWPARYFFTTGLYYVKSALIQ